jgi:WD40 repeat protein
MQFLAPWHLVSSSLDGKLVLWDIVRQKAIFSLHVSEQALNVVRLHSQTHLITGGSDRTLRTFRIESQFDALARREVPYTIIPERVFDERAAVYSLNVSKLSGLVFSGCSDGMIRVWDLTQAKILEEYSGHRSPVTEIALLEDASLLVAGSASATPQ